MHVAFIHFLNQWESVFKVDGHNNNNNNNDSNKSNELKMISVDIVPVTLWSHLVSSQGVYVGVNHNYTISWSEQVYHITLLTWQV